MRILLPIDDSKFSEAALDRVIGQSRPESAEVRVLHIVEPLIFPAMNVGPGYYPPAQLDWDVLQKQMSQDAHKLVEGAAQKLRAAGFRTEAQIREGFARPEIVDIASEWPADLIVIGAHGRTGLQRLLLGSVSDFVARHAKCSVEIFRMPRSEGARW